MDGKEIVRTIEQELFLKGISKGDFYKACGMNSATLSNWRNGVYEPSSAKLHVIEDYLGISFTNGATPDPREELREDLQVLLRSAKDLPPSSVYALVAQIEKEKENAT